MKRLLLLGLVAAALFVPASSSATDPTFASSTAYAVKPVWTPKRTVSVASGTALKTAITNLQAGDLVKASAPFTYAAATSNAVLLITKRLTAGYAGLPNQAGAMIDLTNVTIKYTGTAEVSDVGINNASHIMLYGGTLTQSTPTSGGNACVLQFSSQYVTWWKFHCTNEGGGGYTMFTGKPGYSYTGPVQHNDIEGEVDHINLNKGEYDPHLEHCTGVHGSNMADGNYFDFSFNRVALDVHDAACIGGGIEFGSSQTTNIPHDNTIILQCANFTFKAKVQTGSNCYQTWGYGNINTDLKYVSASNIQGHVYAATGMYGLPNTRLSTDKVEFGRAVSDMLNPFEYNKEHNHWETDGGTVFQNVSPLP